MTEDELLHVFEALEKAGVEFIVEAATSGFPIQIGASELLKFIDLDELNEDKPQKRRRRRKRVKSEDAVPMDDCGVPANLQVTPQIFLTAIQMRQFNKDIIRTLWLQTEYQHMGINKDTAKEMAENRLIDERFLEQFDYDPKRVIAAIRDRIRKSGGTKEEALEEIEKIKVVFDEWLKEKRKELDFEL